MHKENNDPTVSRRGFIKGAAATAIAATAVGAGAAALKNQQTAATTNVYSAPITAVSVPTAAAIAAISSDDELLAQLASLRADNTRLQMELNNSQLQLNAFQQTNLDNTSVAETLSVELNQANERVGVMAGLVALYEQLDEVQLDELLNNGLTAVSDSITDFFDDVPGLEQGVMLGAVALDEFEAHIPLLQNGRSWLQNHLSNLQTYFSSVEKALEKTVARVGPILEMVQNWFADVQKWLPFGIGQQAADVMANITTLLVETPATISGLSTNISDPLDVWLATNADNQAVVQQTLVRPLREQVIAKSTTAVSKARTLDTTYQEQLAAPVKTAVDRQHVLKQLIVQYREQNRV